MASIPEFIKDWRYHLALLSRALSPILGAVQVRDETQTPAVSSLQVRRSADSAFADVGFAALRMLPNNTPIFTVGRDHNQSLAVYLSATGTGEISNGGVILSSASTFPIGGSLFVFNRNITNSVAINVSGFTGVQTLTGSSVLPGARTINPGGYAQIIRYDTFNFVIFGAGIS